MTKSHTLIIIYVLFGFVPKYLYILFFVKMKNVYKALFWILTFGLFVIWSEAMAGNISISRTDQWSSISVSANANMVRWLVANLNTSSSDYLNQLYVYVDWRDATGNIINPMRDLWNLRLYISWEIADYTSNILQTWGKYYYSFNTYRNINTWSNEIELRFDTNSSAISGDTISFMINTGSFSGDIYSRNTIIWSAKSATFYIKKLWVNVSIIDSQANSKRVSWSSNFTWMEVWITPNDGGDLLLNGFDFNISSFGWVKWALNNNYVIDATLVYSGRDLQTIPFNNSGFVHFNYLNILLKKSTQSNIYIKVNTTLSHPSSSINDVQ